MKCLEAAIKLMRPHRQEIEDRFWRNIEAHNQSSKRKREIPLADICRDLHVGYEKAHDIWGAFQSEPDVETYGTDKRMHSMTPQAYYFLLAVWPFLVDAVYEVRGYPEFCHIKGRHLECEILARIGRIPFKWTGKFRPNPKNLEINAKESLDFLQL